MDGEEGPLHVLSDAKIIDLRMGKRSLESNLMDGPLRQLTY